MQPIKQPKPFPCENCTKSFKSGNRLKYHLNKVHSDKEPQHIRHSILEDEPKTKSPKSVPAALTLKEETSLPGQMDLLTEFALIATSPQSPLMQKCKGSQFEISNSWEQHRTSPSPDIPKPSTPPPQLMDPRTPGLYTCASETSAAVQPDSLVFRSLMSDRRDSSDSADSAQFSQGCPSPERDDLNKFDFTALDSTAHAALTLSIMAKDRMEHNQRSKLIRTTPVKNEVSTLKRTSSVAELDRDKTKRPMNAFMLFAKRFRVEITQAHPGKDNRAISVILGDKWKGMKQDERKQYVQEAKLLAEEHKRINPDCWKRKRTQGRHQVPSCRRF